MRPPALCLVATLALGGAASAQALLVPTQFSTIGTALAAASSGQTVLVAAGTYQERITWPGTDGIRLIGEGGAANTIIDGAQGGTVIAFGGGLTRATLLQGFTITNGLLNGSVNDGAGIFIAGSSPTIRDNRLTGNVGIGQFNRGGAIYVTGSADPLIAHNEIDDNALLDGQWNRGAGIYVDSPSCEIVGNWIHDNRTLTTNSAIGHQGRGAGIYCCGAPLIASNLITGNSNNTSAFNYGGGLYVCWANGTAAILNNTFAGNSVTGGFWRFGGGVYVSDQADATLRGNIVVDSVGHGIYRAAGLGSGVVDSDFDCVWNNTAGNYSGLTAGGGSISVDPQFVSANDFHLTAGSPCIDAIPNSHLPIAVGTDFDEDPRQLDIGAASNTVVDIGADEFSEARLEVFGPPLIGITHGWVVNTGVVRPALFAVSFASGNSVIPPYGNLLLGPQVVVVAFYNAPAGYGLAIPNDPTLRGVTIFGQTLLLAPTGPGGQFTNVASVTVF